MSGQAESGSWQVQPNNDQLGGSPTRLLYGTVFLQIGLSYIWADGYRRFLSDGGVGCICMVPTLCHPAECMPDRSLSAEGPGAKTACCESARQFLFLCSDCPGQQSGMWFSCQHSMRSCANIITGERADCCVYAPALGVPDCLPSAVGQGSKGCMPH